MWVSENVACSLIQSAVGLQASGGSRSPASLGPHFCNLKGPPLVLTFSQHLPLLALGVGRFSLFPVSLLLVGGGGWGELSPQTPPADILRVLEVLAHIQDLSGPFFFLPQPQGRGPADGHLSCIIHLYVIITLGESRLQKRGMIKEKTER